MKSQSLPLQTGNWGFKSRHLIIVFIILLVLLGGTYVFGTHNEAFEDAERFARTNNEIAKRVGNISQVSLRFWDGFHVTYSGSSGDASFVLGLKGTQEESILDIRLTRVANSWRVDKAYLSTRSEKGISVLDK